MLFYNVLNDKKRFTRTWRTHYQQTSHSVDEID